MGKHDHLFNYLFIFATQFLPLYLALLRFLREIQAVMIHYLMYMFLLICQLLTCSSSCGHAGD